MRAGSGWYVAQPLIATQPTQSGAVDSDIMATPEGRHGRVGGPARKEHLMRQRLNTTVNEWALSSCTCSNNENTTYNALAPWMQSTWLLVLVVSHPARPHKRSVQRRTWLCRNWRTARTWKYLYVQGKVGFRARFPSFTRSSDTLKLQTVQEDYRNLTLKVFTAFKWAIENVDFKVLLKTDDDTIVHVGNLMEWLARHSTDLPWIYAGQHIWNASPVRREGNMQGRLFPQHVIPRSLDRYFNLSNKYPPFASGTGYVLGLRAVSSLLSHRAHVLSSQTPSAQEGMPEDVMVGLLLRSFMQKQPLTFRTVSGKGETRSAKASRGGYSGAVISVLGDTELMTVDPDARFCAMLAFSGDADLPFQEDLYSCIRQQRAAGSSLAADGLRYCAAVRAQPGGRADVMHAPPYAPMFLLERSAEKDDNSGTHTDVDSDRERERHRVAYLKKPYDSAEVTEPAQQFMPAASCRRVHTCACSRSPLQTPRRDIRFYLHDGGAFDNTDLHPPEDLDNELPIRYAQHLTDYFMVNALAEHSHRVPEPYMACVHMLAVLPFASFVLNRTAHERRMEAVAAQLAKNAYFISGAPFVLFMSYWDINLVLGPKLLQTMRQGHVVLATSDFTYPAFRGNLAWLMARTIILPYRAHRITDASASAATKEEARPVHILFHGWTGRSSRDPSLRSRLFRLLHAVRGTGKNVSLNDDRIADGDPHEHFKKNITRASVLASLTAEAITRASVLANLTAEAMLRTNVCVVPEGDTWTSRRLFDALASGCVPLLVRGPRRISERRQDEGNLPFPASIDWCANEPAPHPSTAPHRRFSFAGRLCCSCFTGPRLLLVFSSYPWNPRATRRHCCTCSSPRASLPGSAR